MLGTRLTHGAPRQPRLWKLVAFGMIVAGLAGCQEDSGASRAASSQANEASEERLDSAVSSFRDTLGQTEENNTTLAGDQREESAGPPTLRWEAPVTREDGSRLYASDISGYRVYYRLRHTHEFDVIPLSADASTSLTLDGFPPGAYEFSITTLDDSGLESRHSDAVAVDLVRTPTI